MARIGLATAAAWILLASCTPAATPAAGGEVPTPPPEPDPLVARCRALEQRGGPGFTAHPAPPFAVVGDEPPEVVRGRAQDTVGWAVRLLKKDFFEQDPDRIIDVWLFADEESYRTNTERLFSEVPDTPFGYYSPTEHAMIMNIATGGGTLVHEIVHPFVEANVRDCPVWLNEGLGSLYEACTERDGRILGVTNWRLPGLQAAIRRGELGSFEALTSLSEDAFYGDDSGVYYAQSRYLCYYLQVRGLLRPFWRGFLASREADPTGYATLQSVLGTDDMSAFQAQWERFVLDLSYP